ncbi:hypothetical protein RRG08_031160 [Elysia crispata]|uniref:GON domain-containing protein n=1 Tax=Elysia crispata TaxID=231223 RepID=A0AAE0ZHB2_9GAST|nr:hypothetical protein RRG08_031160 [Elysia crispata]
MQFYVRLPGRRAKRTCSGHCDSCTAHTQSPLLLEAAHYLSLYGENSSISGQRTIQTFHKIQPVTGLTIESHQGHRTTVANQLNYSFLEFKGRSRYRDTVRTPSGLQRAPPGVRSEQTQERSSISLISPTSQRSDHETQVLGHRQVTVRTPSGLQRARPGPRTLGSCLPTDRCLITAVFPIFTTIPSPPSPPPIVTSPMTKVQSVTLDHNLDPAVQKTARTGQGNRSEIHYWPNYWNAIASSVSPRAWTPSCPNCLILTSLLSLSRSG